MNLHMMCRRRKDQFLARGFFVLPNSDRSDKNLWFPGYPRHLGQVNHCQAFQRCHPKLASRVDGNIRKPYTALDGIHSVGSIEDMIIKRIIMIPDGVEQIVAPHSDHPAVTAEPKIMLRRLH